MLNVNTNFSTQRVGYKKQNNPAAVSFKAQPHIDFVNDMFHQVAANPSKLKRNNLPIVFSMVASELEKMGLRVQEGKNILLRGRAEVRTLFDENNQIIGHLRLTENTPKSKAPFMTLGFDHKSFDHKPGFRIELKFRKRHFSGLGSLRLSDLNQNPPRSNIFRPESLFK